MQRTITFDDLDGTSEASETIRFSIGDEFLEIDLSTEHADQFTAALAPYIAVARPYSPAKATTTKGQLSAPERQELMAWAAENSIEVSPRGRIASSIVEQWRAAKNAPQEEHASEEVLNAVIKAGEEATSAETPAEESPEIPEQPTSAPAKGRRR